MSYIYKTKGTCSTQIEVELDGNIVKNVKFTGGCQGNLQAIPRLVEGMTVEEVERRISGIHCGMKNTSCGDQLARALREAYDAQKMHNTIPGLCKSLPRQICLGAFLSPYHRLQLSPFESCRNRLRQKFHFCHHRIWLFFIISCANGTK